MRDDHPCFGGDEIADLFGGLVDRADPVVDVEHLSVAQEFTADGGGDLLVGVSADIGEDRVPFLRRGGEDGRHLADAGHAHLQSARDGGRRHGQHVDVGAQRLDVFLVFDTEALFLVDDDQAEILPADAGLQQPVGADDDVDLAVCHTRDDFLRFGGVGESAQALHRDRERRHPLGEGLQVLLGEQGGRHQYRDLLASCTALNAARTAISVLP